MARLRTIVQVPVLKKSKAPLAVSWLWITYTPRSEKELADEITSAEREPHDHHDHDQGDREHAQPLAEPPHRTDSNRPKRSRRRYSEPVTSTAPPGPASWRARASASIASATDSTAGKNSLASCASWSAASERSVSVCVATKRLPARLSARSIAAESLSARIAAQIT